MGFLIRTGFWFSIVLLLIPFDLGGDVEADTVGPVQTLQAARGAFDDLSGLCERRPEVCEIGRSAMTTVGVRAREAARIAYEMLDERFGEPDRSDVTASIPVRLDTPTREPPAP
jgi:hypothetical protein